MTREQWQKRFLFIEGKIKEIQNDWPHTTAGQLDATCALIVLEGYKSEAEWAMKSVWERFWLRTLDWCIFSILVIPNAIKEGLVLIYLGYIDRKSLTKRIQPSTIRHKG